jgi:hypothetical protein
VSQRTKSNRHSLVQFSSILNSMFKPHAAERGAGPEPGPRRSAGPLGCLREQCVADAIASPDSPAAMFESMTETRHPRAADGWLAVTA